MHLKIDEQKRLGIILDADDDLFRCWQQVKGILEQSGYLSVPHEPVPEGTILEEDGRPIVGIWLMPDNRLPGKIEDFVSYLIRSDDPLWSIADDILQKVIEVDCRFRAAYTIKARLHTWLAWQKIPGKPMGLAITARYVDASNLHAQQLISWVRRVFDLA
ncbi:MAG: hypothetical protein M3Z08_14785 [Chloroflexota bacterium]|nr:hypothetical protein [Chloroflexota bacterium]